MKILKTEVHLFPDYWRVTDAAGELVGLLNPRTADLYDMVEVVDEMIEPPPAPPTVDDGPGYGFSTRWDGLPYGFLSGDRGEYQTYLENLMNKWKP